MASKRTTLPKGVFEREPGSKIFSIRFIGADGKMHREIIGSLSAAKAAVERRRTQKREGKVAKIVQTRKVTFNDLVTDAEKFLEQERGADHAYGQHLQFKRMIPVFGKRDATSIIRAEILDWLDEQADELEWSDSTFNRYLASFSLLFRIASEHDKVPVNPVHGIRRRQEDNTRVRFLSPEEETKITDVLSHKYPGYLNVFILALHTGARTSEILRAQVGDFDEPTGMLTIRQQKDIRKPKIRLVPATPKAIDAYKGLAAGKQAGAPLCTNRQGGQLYEYRYWLVPAIELSGVKDFTPKDLRHTAASRWVMSGVPIAAVAKYLGHSTIQMTVMRYSHLTPNVNAQAIAAAMSYYDKKTIPTGAESSHPSAK